ncbi:glycosyltransferase family 4 protein [Chenggangzhangella methanolivorans]|uniref:Glycosyltransferase family 4 protein n=1 Tax=Chenggangzhangella methanolivorans TaxID=1437009 RepID=A0A9E6RBF8_9HYPH|nr:glycosyltransferase family 4 protein [Chenggangzhangella methanolivorans]QZO01285.1 glycosyltransferase family 4 protein [Chenggangzhangella methanolivorans]
MKIVIVNRFFAPDQSATSRMATSLATGLAASGFEVEAIASASFHDDPSRKLPPSETIDGVGVTRIDAARFGRGRTFGRALDYLSFHAGAAWGLLRRVSPGDVCVVCTDPPLMSISALPALVIRRAALVNWLNDLFPEAAFGAGMMRGDGLIGRILLALRDFSVRRAAANVAPIERMAAALRSRNAERAKISVVHHWSEGEALKPMPRGLSPFRRDWGLEGKFVLGYSGNLGRAHDFTTLIEAADRLRARKDIAFLIVGGGHRLGWVISEAARRKLPNLLIRPLQPEARLRECLAAADAHFVSLLPAFESSVVPSKFYGVAAAGRATLFVGDRRGEIARLLEDGDCGASFEIGESLFLARAIERYADDPVLVDRLGGNARRLFEARFSRDRGLAAWRDVVMSCATRPASGRLRGPARPRDPARPGRMS